MRWLDPVVYINQTTGQIDMSSPVNAYHIGGGWVNLAIPFNVDWPTYGGAIGFLDWVHEIFFSIQPLGNLAGPGIVGGPAETMTRHLNNVIVLGKMLDNYCQQASKNYNIPYARSDLLSSIPVTPDLKAWLAANSDLYDPLGIDPPTLWDSLVDVIMDGVCTPVLPYTNPNADTVWYEKLQTQLGYNPDFWLTRPTEIQCRHVKMWLQTDAGKLYPVHARTLQLLANAYP